MVSGPVWVVVACGVQVSSVSGVGGGIGRSWGVVCVGVVGGCAGVGGVTACGVSGVALASGASGFVGSEVWSSDG